MTHNEELTAIRIQHIRNALKGAERLLSELEKWGISDDQIAPVEPQGSFSEDNRIINILEATGMIEFDTDTNNDMFARLKKFR